MPSDKSRFDSDTLPRTVRQNRVLAQVGAAAAAVAALKAALLVAVVATAAAVVLLQEDTVVPAIQPHKPALLVKASWLT